MYNSKPAVKSLGVTAPIIAILVIALGAFGVDISGDVAGLSDKIAGVIDSVIAIAAIAVGIYGRVRAKVEIKGIIHDK
jgi:hypothetical protein